MSPRFLSFIKVIGIAFVLVLSAELILRITGLFIVSPEQGYDNLADDKNKIRILTIGESTTDERFAAGKSWASQLEKLLTEKGYDVRIYNLGKVGSNSALLLSRLPDQLEVYDPHIVITMMGINDTESMTYDFSEPTLKIQKLYDLVRDRIQSLMSCRMETVHAKHATPENIAGWLTLTSKDRLGELEKSIRSKVNSDEEVATTLAMIGSVIKNREFPFDEKKFFHLLDRARELHPKNDHNNKIMMHVLTSTRQPKCMELSQELLSCGVNLSDEYLHLVSDCHKLLKKNLTHDTFRIRGLSLISGTGFTAKHYQKLAQILKSKNIPLMAMQYPTLPVENLKLNFNDQKDIVFISNEDNFREALKTHHYRDVFKDNFRANWGHTTELGHGLIAGAAMKEVEPMVIRLSRK